MHLAIGSISAQQAGSILAAVPAFVPAMVSPGYVTAWVTNLHGFRQRTLVERMFWSVPLSLAIAPVASDLIGKYWSLGAAAVFFALMGVASLALLGWEGLELRRAGRPWRVGWQPMGGRALALGLFWIALVAVSLVDLESGERLYMSTTLYDHSYRVAWTEAILRGGVPPANPLYWYGHAAPLRSYYFWYAVCAAVARMAHLPARPVFDASCVWAGFGLAALTGLYLKHLLEVGERLRRQFVLAVALLAVTGLDLIPIYWEVAVRRMPLPPDLEWWSRGQVASWLSSLLWVPHHVASLVCSMLAFLLAWMSGLGAEGAGNRRGQIAAGALIALALASGFGVSIYVTFAFFLVMAVWAAWQLMAERKARAVVVLAAGGAVALLLLAPYLRELMHGASGNAAGNGGDHVFALAVREMIPPESLLRTRLLHGLWLRHPEMARNGANLILLAPGYVLELGFFLVVLVVYLVPRWRGGGGLSAAERALLTIAVATLVFISGIRSWVLETNDFGWRAALFLQFVLLLLGSQWVAGWPGRMARVGMAPRWLWPVTAIALWVGVAGTACQALVLRFYMPLAAAHDAETQRFVHSAYIARIGYGELERAIPADVVVEYNPRGLGLFGIQADLMDVDHQVAMFSDRFECGSLWGGDPAGCAGMRAAVDALFLGGTAEQARATCAAYGIDDLAVRVYDPAWNDRQGWVWTLRPVVGDAEFRVLDCRR
jgi:hypothetical protein